MTIFKKFSLVSIVLLVLLISLLFFTNRASRIANKLSPFNIRYLSDEEIIDIVEKNQEDLKEINDFHHEKYGYDLFSRVTAVLTDRWASNEIMFKWHKTILAFTEKEYGEKSLFFNMTACFTLPFFIMGDARKEIEGLPELYYMPLFGEAKEKYLNASPEEFCKWISSEITEKSLPAYELDALPYCNLLEAAGVYAKNYEIAKKANELLYARNACFKKEEAVSNIAYYSNKLGNLSDADKKILLDYYEYAMKEFNDEQQGEIIRIYNAIDGDKIPADAPKRLGYILYMIKKYKLLPSPPHMEAVQQKETR